MGSLLQLHHDLFHENTATEMGGGVAAFSSVVLQAKGTQFVRNLAGFGGGVSCCGCLAVALGAVDDVSMEGNNSPGEVEVVLRGNRACYGGGLFVRDTVLCSSTHVVFEGNSAASGGGALLHSRANAPQLVFFNTTIFELNTAAVFSVAEC